MAINFDKKIKNTETIILGGKEREIVFNDDFRNAITQTGMKTQQYLDKADHVSEKEIDKMSLNEIDQQVSKYLKDAKTIMFAFFDRYMGKGTGQELYTYFNHSTKALGDIIGELYNLSEKVDRDRSKAAQEKSQTYMSNKRK